MYAIIELYLFMLGAALGSFCNMLVYRLPRHEGLGGHSYCDVTGKQLKPIDLIPIISYIIFRGKCRECGGKLPLKYPLIELSDAYYQNKDKLTLIRRTPNIIL